MNVTANKAIMYGIYPVTFVGAIPAGQTVSGQVTISAANHLDKIVGLTATINAYGKIQSHTIGVSLKIGNTTFASKLAKSPVIEDNEGNKYVDFPAGE